MSKLPDRYFIGLIFTYVILWMAYVVIYTNEVSKVEPFTAVVGFFINVWIVILLGKFCVKWNRY